MGSSDQWLCEGVFPEHSAWEAWGPASPSCSPHNQGEQAAEGLYSGYFQNTWKILCLQLEFKLRWEDSERTRLQPSPEVADQAPCAEKICIWQFPRQQVGNPKHSVAPMFHVVEMGNNSPI